MKIVLLGAPGSGKGTQAVDIANNKKIPHISTGDILRANMAAGSALGVQAKGFIDRGQLVPDALIVDLVLARILEKDCENGWLLDGFPRTQAQAEALDRHNAPDKVLNIVVPLEKLLNRIVGRRVCQKCGKSFHVSSYTASACDACGAALIQRKDDTPETVSQRLEVYKDQTAPLISYYKKRGNLIDVNGDQPVEVVAKEIGQVL